MTKRVALTFLSAWVGLACATGVPAQDSIGNETPQPTGAYEKGFTLYERFDGTTSPEGQFTVLTSEIGYNFTRSFGMSLGLPAYFVVPSSAIPGRAPASPSNTTSGLSNVFLDMRLAISGPWLRSTSTLTGTAPSGNVNKGLSTARATFYWDNRFEHDFGRVAPYLDLAAGNTIGEFRNLAKPYITLGKAAHFETGGDFEILRSVTFTTLGYTDVPWGQQKVFSRVIQRPSSKGGSTRTSGLTGESSITGGGSSQSSGGASKTTPRKGGFEQNPQTVGGADLTRDHGVSASLTISSSKFVDLNLGDVYSFPFHLNTVAYGIDFNLTPLFKRARGPKKIVNP